MSEITFNTCRVCELLDKDKKLKYVTYCQTCERWMCLECEWNPLRRGQAMLIEKIWKKQNKNS